MIKQENDIWLRANWPAPAHIRAGTSIRTGGASHTPYDQLNLATHVGDEIEVVNQNRQLLLKHLKIPSEPVWLEQIHSSKTISLDTVPDNIIADGCHTSKRNTVCAILTADCVPVLFCNSSGTKIAAIHAGWRGICNGIIENTLQQFSDPTSILVWIGPCISDEYYQVGKDVYERCLAHSLSLKTAFQQIDPEHWNCNISNLVKIILKNCKVGPIYECGLCTYKRSDLFFSYRRDGDTGRTASMIWME